MRYALLTLLVALQTVQARQVPTFAGADLVLGQPGFTTANAPAPPSAAGLLAPSGVAVDPGTGKAFISDTGNHRVLRYANAAALANGADAEVVFGQSDFTSNGSVSPPTAASLDSPSGLWLAAGGRLWVADTGNNRIVMYSDATEENLANGPAAALILGQPDATGDSAPVPPSAASLNTPLGVCGDNDDHLWVADSGNNRVLRFDNAASATTGDASAGADGVFGQGQGTPFGSSTAGSDNLHFTNPRGVAIDASGTLWVADTGNNRIMGFPSAAGISNGANGSRILGQPDYNPGSTAAGLSASAVSAPTGLFADNANNLWVLDQGNNRALMFANISTIENGRPASIVVGQPGFDSSISGLSSRQFDLAGANPVLGIFVHADGSLWISDRNHNRVLHFSEADSEAPTVAISGRSKVRTKKRRLVVRGTAADDTAVTGVFLKVGKKQMPANGTTTWKKVIRLKKKRIVVLAFAFDATGKVSAPAKVVITRKQKP